MTLLLIMLLLVCLWGIRLGHHEDFLSPAFTTSVKGVFTFLILFSHARGYIQLSASWIDSWYGIFQDYMGQLIVAMFFFYSGYGIWISFKRKPHYEKRFFKNRILKILLHFDIAVLLFILVQLFIPKTYSVREYLLCWVGFESVGNSNWFIFVILCLYLIANFGMWVHRKLGRYGITTVLILTAALWLALRLGLCKESWWVDTMAVFPLGMLVASNKEELVDLLEKRFVPYVMTAAFLILFGVWYDVAGIDLYGGTACLFCCVVVMATSWITIGNPVLKWAGKNAFTVYIIQRLPMIVLSALGLNEHPAWFLVGSFLLTFLFAEGLSRLYSRIDTRLFANGR